MPPHVCGCTTMLNWHTWLLRVCPCFYVTIHYWFYMLKVPNFVILTNSIVAWILNQTKFLSYIILTCTYMSLCLRKGGHLLPTHPTHNHENHMHPSIVKNVLFFCGFFGWTKRINYNSKIYLKFLIPLL